MHLPLFLQVRLVWADDWWISGVCVLEWRSPPKLLASPSASPTSDPLVPGFGTQLPLPHPWHTAGQLPDGLLQGLFHSDHRLHDAPEFSGTAGRLLTTPLLLWQMISEYTVVFSCVHVVLHWQERLRTHTASRPVAVISQVETCQGQGQQSDKAQTHSISQHTQPHTLIIPEVRHKKDKLFFRPFLIIYRLRKWT